MKKLLLAIALAIATGTVVSAQGNDKENMIVVPAVQTVFSPIIALLQAIHHIHAQFQLCRCRLASGHIQLQIFFLKLLVCLLTFCLKCLQLCTTFFL